MRVTIAEDFIARTTGAARWRARKAEEHACDPREAQAAAALERAARDLRALPGDDPRLVRIQRFVDEADGDVAGYYLVEAGDIIACHGFGRADASTDELLAALVEAAESISAG